jgi:hypothetical protein
LETLIAAIGESFISYLQQFNKAINQEGSDKEVSRKNESCLKEMLHLSSEYLKEVLILLLTI